MQQTFHHKAACFDMHTLIYDGSFAGWLTAVFEVYEYKLVDVVIQPEHQRQDNFFGSTQQVHTDEVKAARVWKGLQQRVSRQASMQVYKTFLSERGQMEDMLLRYVQYAFANKTSIEKDYSHPAVLYVTDMAKKVHREKHRMEAFVRFEETRDHIYYSMIEPDYNVLPLIQEHFEKRYADQRWMIYDVRRKYGLYYDLHQTQQVTVSFNDMDAKHEETVATISDNEQLYQHLWQLYFNSVNIAARKNMKLHIQHMPRRYWKYLTEKF